MGEIAANAETNRARHGLLDGLFRCARSLAARTMPVSVRINWLLQVRLALANQRELKPLADVPGIRSLGNELSSEPLDKQKHLFPDGVYEHHVREIDN